MQKTEYAPGLPVMAEDMVLIGKIASRPRLDVGPVVVAELDTPVTLPDGQISRVEVVCPIGGASAHFLTLAVVGQQVTLMGHLMMLGTVDGGIAPVFLLRRPFVDVSGKPPLAVGAYMPVFDQEGLFQLRPAGSLQAVTPSPVHPAPQTLQ